MIFKVQAQLELDASVIAKKTKASGRFILASNVLDVEELKPDEMIVKYKEQQSAKRGFGFLKDPLFFTDSVFLKSPERIEALALVMGLCLLVYTLGQRLLPYNLQLTNSTVKNQLIRQRIDLLYDGYFKVFNQFMSLVFKEFSKFLI